MPRVRTALITGASTGIGRELAERFARDGSDLVLVARTAETLERAAAELRTRYAITCTALVRDLAADGAAAGIYDAVRAAGLEIDALVNNAGFANYGTFVEVARQDDLDQLAVNVVALTDLTKLFLPGMLQRGFGRVLNVASTAAFVPGPLMSVYYASKAYVLSFSQALADEVRGTGVSVTVLCPGATATEFQTRAKLQTSLLFRRGGVARASDVAAAGYRALMRGQSLAVPGWLNHAVPVAARLLPRGVMARLVRKAQASL